MSELRKGIEEIILTTLPIGEIASAIDKLLALVKKEREQTLQDVEAVINTISEDWSSELRYEVLMAIDRLYPEEKK